ncbi:MAG: DegV family EDD domain-containing protein [Bacilli bacterium]|nr:DegV family EDD domain-containing protein [Bacilli bacterium]
MEYLNGNDLFNMFKAGTVTVMKKRKLLNDLNVFPVPDGDTGNNLVYTMQTITNDAKTFPSFHETLDSISESALIGARGNSGIIFAQFVNGLRMASQGKSEVDVTDFSEMAQMSVVYVYRALEEPVEGTMITVIKDWANFLNEHKKIYTNVKDLLLSAFEEAKKSLERTTEILKVLKKNKVVDSGAMGFVLFLEGFNRYLNNEELDFGEQETLSFDQEHHFHEEFEFRYCTEGLVKYHEYDEEVLKEELNQFGDSLITAKGKELFRVHIHTNTPVDVFETLGKYGTIMLQKVDDMVLEVKANNTTKKIALVTDSIADIDLAFALEHDIFVIPVNILLNGSSYLDKYTINNEVLFQKIESKIEYPTTALPEVKYIKNLLNRLVSKYENILIMTVAGNLSGTNQVMKSVSEEYRKDQNIFVVDTLNNSATEGLLVKKAATLIAEGKSIEEVIAVIEEEKHRTKILVCLETFKYAMMGGRVPKAVGKIGMAIGLRPIMSLTPEGKGTAFGFALSKKGITKKIQKLISEVVQKEGIDSYAIVHCQNESMALEYQEIFTKMIGKAPQYITEISSATAIHSGLGSVAIGYITNERVKK